ncbi:MULTISPECIES: ABC transporter ATP-binding protein [Eubacterium]|jgi:ABC-2 type transport system ATP-binding protein|uniref:ABC-2 type transport system ATP-binding protein n=1 Tax=Eubacterium ruminantium TaxID=42322 RepID=A0A1T4K9Z8_9FIRM|nr:MULTISPECIES: ABC transporter ATP-binding protein [Eubacterium]MCR5366991.1 ABC transporter ATP-binding protein [Eubacterium sp.]SCW26730.1 ABC-2 type transport system ATP-binding protein [Eubacterium ruminantium]SDM17413.1 ABC-2 type transport system ATP-binding protein [Eubacterium ruminantium]SJZ39143.1 ABC-2 type transport system ATP-binding protein [Eubacterium ruminantium]
MLYLSNLVKYYNDFLAVAGINLHVPKGDLFGFVGPNGAGKTTTIRMTCGLLQPTSGGIWINGISQAAHADLMKKQIGYVPDFFGVYDNLKVSEYMEFYGSLYGIGYREIKNMTAGLLELVNLSDKLDENVDSLSRGMKQRLCVARALLHNPELLILDEPSSGLDPRARIEMKELLMNLQSMGKTIIISSHILSELSEMCNSIGIMNKGRIVAAGTIDDILGRGRQDTRVIIGIANDIEKASMIAKENPEILLDSVRENQIIIRSSDDTLMNRYVGQLISNEVIVTGIIKEENSLETLFMQLTGDNVNYANQSNN